LKIDCRSFSLGLFFFLNCFSFSWAITDSFIVYEDWRSDLNRYSPGYDHSGDSRDIEITERESNGLNNTCIRIKYSARRYQNKGWVGVYWQDPSDNWGHKVGGFDLSGYKKLIFQARGENGGEEISQFFMGNISGQGEKGDSGEAYIDQIALTKKWKIYSINLVGVDLSHIINGFGFYIGAGSNPNGMTFYLDDIKYIGKTKTIPQGGQPEAKP